MAYTKYSLTPANNNAAPPDGAPEGMLPSAVNDTMRDMMAQIRDVGDGIRGGTYTMTAPVITGGSITGVALSGNTFTNPVITGGSINNTPIGATTANTGKFTTLTNAALTSGRVTYAGTSGVLQDDADFTFNGTTVTMANDASISSLRVGQGNTAGSANTALGLSALNVNTGAYNTAIGYESLIANTSGANNTALGFYSLRTNTTAANNTALGNQAMQLNTTGATNTAVGSLALYSNTTASNNTAVGMQAGYATTTGAQNAYFGKDAGKAVTTANWNTFIGVQAGLASTGSQNTFVGASGDGGSGYLMTSGAKNTILGGFSGNQGGLDIRTASNHIVLSDGDGNPRLYFSGDQWRNTATANAAHKIVEPNGGGSYLITEHPSSAGDGYSYHVFSWNNGTIGEIRQNGTTAVSYITTSDYRLKENIAPMTGALAKVAQLKPCTYTWKSDGSVGEGFIAHELAKVCPIAVAGDKDAINEDGSIKPQGIDTSFLVATLTAAIQELKAEFDAYKATHP
jgi:hypothetical protein